MPIIYKHNLKQFTSNKNIANEPSIKPVYRYNSIESLGKAKEGDGIFSGIGSLINVIKNNKDLISSVAKGAAAIGSTASAISNAVKSQNELKQIEATRKLRNNAKDLQKDKKLSEESKNKIANLKSIEEIRGNRVTKGLNSGAGLAKF